MADQDYHKDLVNPRFSEMIPRFSRVEPVVQVLSKTKIKNFFAVGRLVPKKGFVYLLEAMNQVVAEHPDIHLKIAANLIWIQMWNFSDIEPTLQNCLLSLNC